MTPDPGDVPYPLGRNLYHDPRNRDYPIRELLPRETTPKRRPWWRRGVYDQGSESSCTAQAAAGVLESSPNRQVYRGHLPHYDEVPERFELYREAQRHDPWQGEEPQYKGSSTDAPFKVLRNRGQIAEWRWCFGIQDVIDTLNVFGPVALGTTWHHDMFRPDANGYVSLTGGVAGGHAYETVWYDLNEQRFRCVNSWDRSWGQSGRFWLRYEQVEALLADRGEAVTIVLA